MGEKKVIVCVKPIPDPRHWDRIRINPKDNTIVREGIQIVLSQVDKNAIEEALTIKDKHGWKVIVISMAPPNTKEALSWAYAMGADEVILLCDRKFAGADSLATAYTLSQAISKLSPYDLILCGNASPDSGTGHIVPQIAEFLDVGHMNSVVEAEIGDDNILTFTSQSDAGIILGKAILPVALGINQGSNVPRIPSLFGALAAEERPVLVWDIEQVGSCKQECVGIVGSPSVVKDLRQENILRVGTVLSGDPSTVCTELVKNLRSRGFIQDKGTK